MTDKPYLSIVIPTHNEEKAIGSTILSINNFLSRKGYGGEIVLVNDGSIDNTVRVAKDLQRTIKNLRIIDNQENRGKGCAVSQGMSVLTKNKPFEISGEKRSVISFLWMRIMPQE